MQVLTRETRFGHRDFAFLISSPRMPRLWFPLNDNDLQNAPGALFAVLLQPGASSPLFILEPIYSSFKILLHCLFLETVQDGVHIANASSSDSLQHTVSVLPIQHLACATFILFFIQLSYTHPESSSQCVTSQGQSQQVLSLSCKSKNLLPYWNSKFSIATTRPPTPALNMGSAFRTSFSESWIYLLNNYSIIE